MDTRIRALFLFFLSLIVLAIWTFPQWYPLVNRQSVTIAFAGLETEAQADFLLLPPDLRQAYQELREDEEAPAGLALALVRARLLTEDSIAPEESAPFELPEGASAVRRGNFIQTDLWRGAQGNILIYQMPDTSIYLRLEDFRTTRAPDLRLVLTRNPDPYDSMGVRVDYIDLGVLPYTVGNQTFVIPQGIDFRQYPTLALYSPALNTVISSATLR